ncbi:M56 family metallopeptidase [Mucilaginibacter sp. FT3.2]|uniref:M56 family metallopeptidase n=1 Tax=Mucilaginibacter sp. FT3.2 TaxID=2723090 RepID=UPI0016140D7D|nr:M56 family metallopeptidase [Mucilaginibacter sp. FT3.2]MBB6233762.1 hypothetical protein [Mucilaginibacter sp. FT3.2]
MIPYLLYVALLITICLLFYKLLLQRETFYRLNRWVILICLPLSFLLPLVHIPQQWSLSVMHRNDIISAKNVQHVVVPVVPPAKKTPVNPVKTEAKQIIAQKPISPASVNLSNTISSYLSALPVALWLFVIYITGVVIFGLNLVIQLIYTLYQAYAQPVIIDGPYRIVELNGDKVPCSFLNNIFINPEKYDWDTYNQILLHEKVHARQLHSIDILLAELAIVVLWFNPFAWWYRIEMENNLEYLTDEAVTSKNNVDTSAYQLSLLKVSTPHLSLRISTNYNQSILKKRILMMSAKKSNLHTLWKYFLLAPLFTGFACALNQPATGKNLINNNNAASGDVAITDSLFKGDIEGFWYANKEGDVLNMDMKIVIKKQDWSYNGFVFPVSAFSSLPLTKQGNFVVKRQAGTILFNGKFEGNQGLGRFKMKFDETYINHLKQAGITIKDEDGLIGLVVNDVKEDYIKLLTDNGFKQLTANQLSTLNFFKVSAADIRFWGHAGFKDLTAKDLQRIKSANIDSSYAIAIRNAGYPNITIEELYRLKADSVTADYIRGITRAKQASKIPGDTTSAILPVSVISTAKYMHIDSTYMRAMTDAGYNLTASQLHSFKSFDITPDYITQLQNLGYYNIPATSLLSLKMSKITPEYIKSLYDAGYTKIPLNSLTVFKVRGITADYIKTFNTIGYINIEPATLVELKVKGITPGFIKGFTELGFSNIPIKQFFTLKNTGVTPNYVASMRQKGLNSKDLQKYIDLKNSFN